MNVKDIQEWRTQSNHNLTTLWEEGPWATETKWSDHQLGKMMKAKIIVDWKLKSYHVIGEDWKLPRVTWNRNYLNKIKSCGRQWKSLRGRRSRVSKKERLLNNCWSMWKVKENIKICYYWVCDYSWEMDYILVCEFVEVEIDQSFYQLKMIRMGFWSVEYSWGW